MFCKIEIKEYREIMTSCEIYTKELFSDNVSPLAAKRQSDVATAATLAAVTLPAPDHDRLRSTVGPLGCLLLRPQPGVLGTVAVTPVLGQTISSNHSASRSRIFIGVIMHK